MTRPSFRTTKAERAGIPDALDTSGLERIYRDVARGRFIWEGLPDGCPEGYIEDTALFFNSGVSIKDVKGLGPVVLPVKASTVGIYGQPVEWLPGNIPGLSGIESDKGLFSASTNPVLWTGASVMDRIRPYLQIMSRALKTLHVNLGALSTPVLIAGRPSGADGDNLTGILLKGDLSAGETYIPCVNPDGLPLTALDLKVTDHSQNLISTCEAMHSKILEIMQSGDGVAKSSGITVEETINGSQSVQQAVDAELELRMAWCERINEALGLSVTVERAVDMTPAPMPAEEPTEGDDVNE